MGIGIHGKKTNNYREKPKQSRIFTPSFVSEKIKNIIIDSELKFNRVLDIGCGNFSLSKNFANPDIHVIGIDKELPEIEIKDVQFELMDLFFAIEFYLTEFNPGLILCNPPFNWQNKDEKNTYRNFRNWYNSNLLPEIFLKRIFDVYGLDIPVVLFVPFGVLFNNRRKSERYKWLASIQDRLASVLYLPVDAFKDSGVLTHSCVTFWNIEGLKNVYFLGEE